MKVRMYPKKEVIRGLLQETLTEEQGLLDEANAKLAAITGSLLIRPGDDSSYRNQVERCTRTVKVLNDRLATLDAHAPPEVMVEFDL